MGGSGAAIGKGKNPYGTEYTTVYQQGNIKYITRNNNSASAPLETQTSGRVYATVNADGNVAFISYYDKANRRSKTIDLLQPHKIEGKAAHVHTTLGYLHNGLTRHLTPKEQKMVDRVLKTWRNRK